MKILENLQHLKDDNKIDVVILVSACKSIVNLCNGSLMSISEQRNRNIDAGREADDFGTDPARAEELGFATQLKPTQRGDCFASIRREVREFVEGYGWTLYDAPQFDMRDYIESRISGMRRAEPREDQIRAEMKTSYSTRPEAIRFLIEQNTVQAAKLEHDLEDVVAAETDYDDTIDADEAVGILGIGSEYRIWSKIIDGIMYEASRLQEQRKKTPNYQLLVDKMGDLNKGGDLLYGVFEEFEKTSKAALNKEHEANPGRPLVGVRPEHVSKIMRIRRMDQEEREIQIEAARRDRLQAVA